MNGATCSPSLDENIQYTCTCAVGCTGRNCESCGCNVGINVCQNGGICLASGSCQCPASYTGTNCQTCSLEFINKKV